MKSGSLSTHLQMQTQTTGQIRIRLNVSICQQYNEFQNNGNSHCIDQKAWCCNQFSHIIQVVGYTFNILVFKKCIYSSPRKSNLNQQFENLGMVTKELSREKELFTQLHMKIKYGVSLSHIWAFCIFCFLCMKFPFLQSSPG